MEQTVAQLILETLAAWGVKNIYGVSGDAILPFMDALRKQEKIKFYSTANEQGAAFMACGEARITGRPGVCLATEGPGALNLVNGVADAFRDGVPMLVITGFRQLLIKFITSPIFPEIPGGSARSRTGIVVL